MGGGQRRKQPERYAPFFRTFREKIIGRNVPEKLWGYLIELQAYCTIWKSRIPCEK
jgi:hypothetical protein